MRQTTAKTQAQALRWIDTNPHHKAAWDTDPGFFVLSNHQERLRIPQAIHAQMDGCVQPGDRLDARMYVLTSKGRRRLNKALAAGDAQP